MIRVDVVTHEFVESAPDKLDEGKIYVSIPFATVLHKCCCGCGTEVVTPLSPAEWQLTFDGETISLYPSIGNWGLRCGSHYFIERNKVRWAGRWSQAQIDAGRAADRRARRSHLDDKVASPRPASETSAPPRRLRFPGWARRLWMRLTRQESGD